MAATASDDDLMGCIGHLANRIVENHRRADQVTAARSTARRRSSDFHTESVLLVLELARFSPDRGGEWIIRLREALKQRGLDVDGLGEPDTDLARIVMGAGHPRGLYHRIACAAREIHASGSNDGWEYLRKHGGATGCARLWWQRSGGPRSKARPVRHPRLIVPSGADVYLATGAVSRHRAIVEADPDGRPTRIAFLEGPKFALLEVKLEKSFPSMRRMVEELQVLKADMRSEPELLMSLASNTLLPYVQNRVVVVHAQTDDPEDQIFAGFERLDQIIDAGSADGDVEAVEVLTAWRKIWQRARFDAATL
jgi:hypothetical protein